MPRKTWCRINAQAGGSAAEILIYDVIGYYWMETSAQDVADKIKDLDVDAITVRINSPGGDAFDGIAIMNTLRAHKATITVHIDGLAASAASVIAMAGDEVVMGPGSQMMIHDAWTYTDGDAKFLRAEADRLDKLSDSIASLYAGHAGGDTAVWRERMLAETWYTADEAVVAGLADRVDGEPVDAAALATFNLSRFTFAGRDHAPAPLIPPAAQAANRKEKPMASLIESLRERLGVAEETDEAGVLEALDEVLAEQAEPETPAPTPDVTAALAAVKASGHVVMDAAVVEQLQAQAQAGADAMAHIEADARDREVQAHINRGAILQRDKEKYLTLMADSPETARSLLEGFPSNKIPVAEVGHGVSAPANESEDLSWFGETPTTKES